VKVIVDLNRCQGYGQCVYAAPNIFQLKGVEILAYDPAPSDQWRDEFERAVHACPVRAILEKTLVPLMAPPQDFLRD
jgi:ferredoxin